MPKDKPHYNEFIQLFETTIESFDGEVYLTHIFTVNEADVSLPLDRGKVARQQVVRAGFDHWLNNGWKNGRIRVSRYWPADHSTGPWRQASCAYEYDRARLENGILYREAP